MIRSATIKTIMTVLAGALGAAALLPQFAGYSSVLTFLAGVLGGGAHVQRPGDVKG